MNSFDKIIKEEYQKILQEQRDTIEISKISPRKTAKMKSIYPDMIDAFKVVAKAPGKSLSRNIVQRNFCRIANSYLFVVLYHHFSIRVSLSFKVVSILYKE